MPGAGGGEKKAYARSALKYFNIKLGPEKKQEKITSLHLFFSKLKVEFLTEPVLSTMPPSNSKL